MIKQQQLEHFRVKLLRQKQQVLTEMGSHPSLLDATGNLEEKADQASNQLVESQICENDSNLLRKIEFALERLEAGTYQQCDHCGSEIPVARLEAKPSVSLCVGCQQAKDSSKGGSG